MGKSLSYVLTFLVGLAFGSAAAGTIAKGRGSKKPTHAKVCGDLKLIHDQALEESTEAFEKGKINAAEKHEADAKYTKDWAHKGGCSWAS
jgi:hypothetical protein